MKGIILAGGKGTRLNPCTLVVNKHLLPIYNKPMIYYPIETLVKAGCKDILIITGEHLGEFAKLIGNGHLFGLNSVLYAYQENPNGGIADALKLAHSFVRNDKFCVILGDNLIFDNINEYVIQYDQMPYGTCLLLTKKVENPSAFGVARIIDNKIVSIIEKPNEYISNDAVIGLYMYDETVFDIISKLIPSKRGELEITDVNNAYIFKNKAEYRKLSLKWIDTGTFKTLLEAINYVGNFN